MQRIKKAISLVLLIMCISIGSCSNNGSDPKPPIDDTPADPIIPIPDSPLSIEFKGDELNLPGYAESTITYKPSEKENVEYYSIFWANEDGILSNYYAIKTAPTLNRGEDVVISIGENILIPRDADRIVICDSDAPDALLAEALIPEEKRLKEDNSVIFASVSDIHVNYTAGAKFWTNALNEYEKAGVSYIAISGDVSEDGSEFPLYQSATESSNYKGLIFASMGNHEQTPKGRENFAKSAIYDGITKTWVSLSNADQYFTNDYSGTLDVSVTYNDIESNFTTCYYYATIGNSLFIFMDQMLASTGNSSKQDNFSVSQISWLSNLLGIYAGDHTGDVDYKYNKYDIFIVEHALIKQFSAGDKYPGYYSQPILINDKFTNNLKFVSLLKEYPEVIWLSGHTHMGFETSFDFIDKQFLIDGTPNGEAMARSIHNSSISQPRWYEGASMVYKNTYENGSEGFVCYKIEKDIIFEGHCFKEFNPGKTDYDPSLFCNKIFPNASFIFPSFVKEHEYIHMHTPGKTIIHEPTATDAGSLETYCLFCEELISIEELPILEP